MTWDVVMEEDGIVILPEELLAKADLEPGAVLEMSMIDGGLLLRPAAAVDHSDHR